MPYKMKDVGPKVLEMVRQRLDLTTFPNALLVLHSPIARRPDQDEKPHGVGKTAQRLYERLKLGLRLDGGIARPRTDRDQDANRTIAHEDRRLLQATTDHRALGVTPRIERRTANLLPSESAQLEWLDVQNQTNSGIRSTFSDSIPVAREVLPRAEDQPVQPFREVGVRR